MSLLTTWGYTITDGIEELPPMLSVEDFNAMTANKYAGNTRIEPNIAAASLAIRNYCGGICTRCKPALLLNAY